jgi:hypothetical protein
MKSGYVIFGILLMIVSFLFPAGYFVLDLLSLGILTALTLGMDWLCCCGLNSILFIIGLVLFIVGLVAGKE